MPSSMQGMHLFVRGHLSYPAVQSFGDNCVKCLIISLTELANLDLDAILPSLPMTLGASLSSFPYIAHCFIHRHSTSTQFCKSLPTLSRTRQTKCIRWKHHSAPAPVEMKASMSTPVFAAHNFTDFPLLPIADNL
jgi:hypothetical protein